MLRSRLYSWTGFRNTGAVASVAGLAVFEAVEGAGMAKRIEVVDSVWRTNPAGIGRSVGTGMVRREYGTLSGKDKTHLGLVRP